MAQLLQDPQSLAAQPSPVGQKSSPLSWRRWIPERWYVHLGLWLACLALGFPVLYALIVSTQNNAEVFRYQLTFGSSFAFNWQQVMVARHLGHYMVNSAIVATAITVGKTVLSLLAGLAFVYFRFPGKGLAFGFVLMTLMMPTEILIIALLRLVTNLGWGSTYYALIVPFLASATATFLFRQHFSNIPRELAGSPTGRGKPLAVSHPSADPPELERHRGPGGDSLRLRLEYVPVAPLDRARPGATGGAGGAAISTQLG